MASLSKTEQVIQPINRTAGLVGPKKRSSEEPVSIEAIRSPATKKKTKKPNEWVDQREAKLDEVLRTQSNALRTKLGTSVTIGVDAPLVGVFLPALCLRYLFKSTILPFGKVIQIVGTEGSNKTTFMYEMIKWHLDVGGVGMVAENEDKHPPDIRSGVMQYDETRLNRLLRAPTASVQQWQEVWTNTAKGMKKLMEDPKGPGWSIPVVLSVDSLTGTSIQGDVDKTDAAGFATGRFGTIAGRIADYLRDTVQLFQETPITRLATNHLKPQKDDKGRQFFNVPGGRAIPFMASYLIKLDKQEHLETVAYGGVRVKLTTTKNSYGPFPAHIVADYLWWYETFEGKYRPRFGWDWHSASIAMLLRFEKEDGKKGLFRELMEIVDLRVTSVADRKLWSKKLGIPEEAPVSYREAGEMLERRPDLLALLYPLLQIAERVSYVTGCDWRDLKAIEQARQEQVKRDEMGSISDLPQLLPNAKREKMTKQEKAELDKAELEPGAPVEFEEVKDG